MPSSLIIVALAAAWLVVLVPMIARKRQEIARTADSALAARVVHSGGGGVGGEEFAMSKTAKPAREDDEIADSAEDELEPDLKEIDEDLEYLEGLEVDDGGQDLEDHDEDLEDYEDPEEPEAEERVADPKAPPPQVRPQRDRSARAFRPGRGGFDPEAAEIAAKAKYAFRQRVVLTMIITMVLTALMGGFLYTPVWWLHGMIDIALVSYLGYLRRQVRIENEIRQRRLARFNTYYPDYVPPRRPRVQEEDDEPEPEVREEVEVVTPPRRELVGSERKPSPTTRIRRHAVVVDIDDEDPAFHELDEPGEHPYRRASGE
jgi:hypothetical protein